MYSPFPTSSVVIVYICQSGFFLINSTAFSRFLSLLPSGSDFLDAKSIKRDPRCRKYLSRVARLPNAGYVPMTGSSLKVISIYFSSKSTRLISIPSVRGIFFVLFVIFYSTTNDPPSLLGSVFGQVLGSFAVFF